MKDKLIIAKLKEINNRYESVINWILRHTPEIQESQRYKNHIDEINDLKSELSALEQELNEQDKIKECEKCPFFKFFKEPSKATPQVSDEDIDRAFPINLNPHTILELEMNNEAIAQRTGAKAHRDGKISHITK